MREILQGYVQHLYRELKKQLWMRPFSFPAVISQADSTSLHAPRLKNVIQKKSYVCSAGYLPTVIQYCHVHWRMSDRGKFNYSLTSPTVSTITRLFVIRFTPGSHQYSNSPFCLLWNCYDSSLENLVFDELKIPLLILFFSFITYLLDIILYCWENLCFGHSWKL